MTDTEQGRWSVTDGNLVTPAGSPHCLRSTYLLHYLGITDADYDALVELVRHQDDPSDMFDLLNEEVRIVDQENKRLCAELAEVRRQDDTRPTLLAGHAAAASDAGENVEWWLEGSRQWAPLSDFPSLVSRWRNHTYSVVARIMESATKKVMAEDLLTMPLAKQVNGEPVAAISAVREADRLLAVIVHTLDDPLTFAPDTLVDVEQ